ncbi:hypothetical protein BG006_002990, partial [Podila minutissima]
GSLPMPLKCMTPLQMTLSTQTMSTRNWVKKRSHSSTPFTSWPPMTPPSSVSCTRTSTSGRWNSQPPNPRTMPSSPWKIWPN